MTTKDEIVDAVTPYVTKWYTIVGALLVVWFIVTTIKDNKFKKLHGCKSPAIYSWDGITVLPLIWRLLKHKNEGTLLELAEYQFKELNSGTWWLRFFTVPVVVTMDPENIKAVLATQFNDFALGTRHAHFLPMLGDGIFTLDGEGWKNSRAMLRPQFAREQVAHVRALEPHVLRLSKHIEKSKGETIDLQELFFRLTVDTSSEFLFGESVESLADDSIGEGGHNDFDGKAGFTEAFNVAQAYLASRTYLQDLYFLVNNSEFRDAVKRVHKFAKFYVRRALEFTPEELEKNSANGYVFLYELVKQTRNPKVLQDQLLNILIAGRDTTAGLLSYTFFELARNPDVFAKLKEEIYTNFGDSSNPRVEEITFESMKKCEYLKWVLNETLRLYPSVPNNFRVALKDTTLPRGGGEDQLSPIFVKKGTTIAYSVHCTHRNEEVYGKDAQEFRPERWADLKRLGWNYIPFNGGPRICLGQQFALTEASYVISRLIQLFPNLETRDFSPYPPKKNVQLTQSHHTGVFVSLHK